MTKTHQLIIELENAQAEEATALVNDLRTHSDLEVMELSSRDIPLLMDFLVPVAAGSAVVLGAKIAAHFRSRGTSIRLKRGKDRELVITSSEDLDPDHVTTVIRDFLDD